MNQRRGNSILDKAKENLKEILREEKKVRESLASSDMASPRSPVLFTAVPEVKPQQRQLAKPPRQAPRPAAVAKHQEAVRDFCTFKPKINPLPAGKAFNYKEKRSWDTYDEWLDDLAKPRTEVVKERELQRKAAEDSQHREKCTFKPAISEFSFKSRPAYDESVEDRLLKLGEEKRVLQERLQKEREEQEAAGFSFHPEVSAVSNKGRPPIHKRLTDIQKEKLEELERLRVELDTDPELTFKPRINENSERLAERRRSNPPKPSRCALPESVSVPASNADFKQFLARQEEYVKRRADHFQERVASYQERESWNFRPSINENSKKIAERLYDEDSKEKIDRLSQFEHARRESARAKREEEYYAKYTYTPKINKLSKTLGKSSSLSQLVYDKEAQMEKQLKAEEYLVQQEHLCSFQPRINENSLYKVASDYKDPREIMKNIERGQLKKELFTQDLKEKRENKQSEACTFKPKINTKAPRQRGPVPVAGLNRFLEVRSLAKKKELEKQQREAQVFGLKNTGSWVHSFTVPEPFELAPASKQAKLDQLKQELSQLEMRECTFRPQTLES